MLCYDRLVPDANNIKSYPQIVWKSDADGKLECFNLWSYPQSLTKLAKLNRDIFTLSFGPRLVPARALILSKKKRGYNSSNIITIYKRMVTNRCE